VGVFLSLDTIAGELGNYVIVNTVINFFFKLLEDPAYSLVPGVGPFSNANIYVLDQHIAETKTDLESTTCPLLSSILH